MSMTREGTAKVELRKVRIDGEEAGKIIAACESAKSLGSATVVIVFKNRRFDAADVSKHYSRVA